MRPEIRDILASVSKPFRYLGGEVGSLRKDWDTCSVRVCLAFPEIYEMGMSHLGQGILCGIVNAEEGMLAERAFAPWQDMEALLRERGMPLFSLESHRPLRDFDVVGMSLASELTYTNVLTMLDLAGIPLRAAARKDGDPLVIAGGPCAFNPMPMAAFFDAIVIGDGEAVILEIARAVRQAKGEGQRAKGTAWDRRRVLESLSAIRGVYVPAVHDARHDVDVGMARVTDLDATSFPREPIAAYAATQERAAVEAARGCTRGCRFCQAGYSYRPLRQRSQATAAELACAGIMTTGRDEFSFLSLSIGDWQPLEPALAAVHAGLAGMPVNATLPSLRVESLTQPVIDMLGLARSGSFTLAPEAATERMRRFINKGNTDEDLYASVEKVFASGWHAIKLYFMLGLPGEGPAEIDGIVEMANRCIDIGRRHHRRPDVTVSTSTFIPKPHTPLQWERQISIEETLTLQRELKRRLRRPGIAYRWHGAEQSFLEGVLARGGPELADAIERAWRSGARFDGWDEGFNLARWREALVATGLDAESYLAERPRDAALPWDHLGAGPARAFLLSERDKACDLLSTEDCATGTCSGCGICDPAKGLVNRVAKQEDHARFDKLTANGGSPLALSVSKGDTPVTNHESRVTVFRYRLRFRKQGRAAFIGHLETLDALRRGLRSAGLPLRYSEGFHPRARIAAGPALPVGVESLAEYADIELAAELAVEEIVACAQGRFPEGISVEEAAAIPVEAPSIEEAMERIRYEIDTMGISEEAQRATALLSGSAPIVVTRERKGRAQQVDVREHIAELAAKGEAVLGLTLTCRQPALRISEILQGLLGIDEQRARTVPVRKMDVEWR